MKTIKHIITSSIFTLVTLSILNCSTTKNQHNNLPFTVGEVYYTKKNTAINIYIPIRLKSKNVSIHSVYFKGKQTKLKAGNNTYYIGHFKNQTKQKRNLNLSRNPKAEYGNEIPTLNKKTNFNLKDNECIIGYNVGYSSKYHKISNIVLKDSKAYH